MLFSHEIYMYFTREYFVCVVVEPLDLLNVELFDIGDCSFNFAYHEYPFVYECEFICGILFSVCSFL